MYVTQLLDFPTVFPNVNLQRKTKFDLSLEKKTLHCDSSWSCLSSDCVELISKGHVFQEYIASCLLNV